MNDKPQDEELTDAYRRASARDADRPSAATRAAILAEAAAAARRNAPAANESRYWVRAVAGIAVLGIGVILWRQTDVRLPAEAPVVASAPVTQTLESATETERARLPQSPPESPQAFPASPAAIASPEPPPAVESNPRQLAQITDDDELEEITVTGARIQIPNNARAQAAPASPVAPRAGAPAAPGGAGGAAPRTVDNTALLRQYFPAQYESDASHSVWVVLDADGEVKLSGELAPGQSLADLAPQLARALGDSVPGRWQVQSLRNSRGQPIELAIARLPY